MKHILKRVSLMAVGVTLAGTLVGVAPAGARHNNNAIILYEDYNRQGASFALLPGQRVADLDERKISCQIYLILPVATCVSWRTWKFNISSVFIPSGSHGLALYEETAYGGRSLQLGPGTYNDFSQFKRNQSLAISPGVWIDLALGDWNDHASSVKACNSHWGPRIPWSGNPSNWSCPADFWE